MGKSHLDEHSRLIEEAEGKVKVGGPDESRRGFLSSLSVAAGAAVVTAAGLASSPAEAHPCAFDLIGYEPNFGSLPANGSWQLAFNQPVNPVTVVPARFSVVGPGGAIPFTLAQPAPNVVRVSAAHVMGSNYTLTINAGIQSTGGLVYAGRSIVALCVAPGNDSMSCKEWQE